jgi:hypothetical protein
MSGNASPSCGGHKAEMGDADVPVIDRSCPLDEAPDAIRYLAGGYAMGKVVVTVTSLPVEDAASRAPR